MSSIWLERRAPDFGGLPRVVSHLHNPGDFSASFSWVVFGALDIESRRGRAGRIANRICYVRVPRFSFNIVAAHFEVGCVPSLAGENNRSLPSSTEAEREIIPQASGDQLC